jgi:hypothetical protein
VRHLEVREVKFGYPIPTANRTEIVREVRDWLESVGIYSEGRFGEWAYINSDEALHRGMTRGRYLMQS